MTAPLELPPESAWWTSREFAAQLRITARWLEDRCAPSWRGEQLPHRRVGRELRFSPEDRAAIAAMFARGPRPPAPAAPQLDVAAGIAGLRKLDRLKTATP